MESLQETEAKQELDRLRNIREQEKQDNKIKRSESRIEAQQEQMQQGIAEAVAEALRVQAARGNSGTTQGKIVEIFTPEASPRRQPGETLAISPFKPPEVPKLNLPKPGETSAPSQARSSTSYGIGEQTQSSPRQPRETSAQGQGAARPPLVQDLQLIRSKEADKIVLEALPTVPKFKLWKSHLQKAVAGASGRPEEAFRWIKEVDQASSIEELYDLSLIHI